MKTVQFILITSSFLNFIGAGVARAAHKSSPGEVTAQRDRERHQIVTWGYLSDEPSLKEVVDALNTEGRDVYCSITPENLQTVHTLLRRIALRADEQVASLIPPGLQRSLTARALMCIAGASRDKGDAAFIRSFFESSDSVSSPAAAIARQATIEVLGPEQSTERDRQEAARLAILGTSIESYAVAARRCGVDDEACGPLLHLIDSGDERIEEFASRAISYLESATTVSGLVDRLEKAEKEFPEDWSEEAWKKRELQRKYSPSPDGLAIHGVPGTQHVFDRVYILLNPLLRIERPDALVEVLEALNRWKRKYKSNPHGEEILAALGVPKLVEEAASMKAHLEELGYTVGKTEGLSDGVPKLLVSSPDSTTLARSSVKDKVFGFSMVERIGVLFIIMTAASAMILVYQRNKRAKP